MNKSVQNLPALRKALSAINDNYLNVQQTFIPHQVALEQMRKGDMAAVVFITSNTNSQIERPM